MVKVEGRDAAYIMTFEKEFSHVLSLYCAESLESETACES